MVEVVGYCMLYVVADRVQAREIGINESEDKDTLKDKNEPKAGR